LIQTAYFILSRSTGYEIPQGPSLWPKLTGCNSGTIGRLGGTGIAQIESQGRLAQGSGVPCRS
jgi:hypothetical protein